jgi:hypothetical protein
MKLLGWIGWIGGLFTVTLLFATLTSKDEAPPTARSAPVQFYPVAEPSEVSPERRAALSRAILLVKAVMMKANDPDSIEVFDAMYTDAGAVAVQYRGRNVFNAKVINVAIVSGNGKEVTSGPENDDDVVRLWNKHIARKKVYDITKEMLAAKLLNYY